MLEQLDIVKFIIFVVNYLNFDGERFCNVDVTCFLFIFSLVCLFTQKNHFFSNKCYAVRLARAPLEIW